MHVRRTSDSPSSVTYSISRASHLRIGPLRLRVGAQKVTAAEVTLNGETKRANWETAPDSAVLTLDLDGIAEDNVEITLSRERAPRYHEVLSHLPQSPREPGLEPDYLLPRVERIIEVLNRYTTIHNVTDATLVDVGCGPGPFPIATALVENPQGMIGVDLKPSIDRATELLESLTVTNVDFAAADMADTAEVVDNADGILVNNSIVFMNSRRKCKRAIRSFASALRPGGGIVLLTANRRYYREPFTGLIGAHWLPRFLASLYVRLRRERETYMDVRIHSTRELMRWLRRAGFTDITAVDADTLTADGRRRFWGERCYVTARRAG